MSTTTATATTGATSTTTAMREPTLQTIGLGSVSEIFRAGRLPVEAGDLVDRVFGDPDERGCMVISGANGIVGAGKTMQLGSRLVHPTMCRSWRWIFPLRRTESGKQYPGLVAAFGRQGADRIMRNIVRLNYDGLHLPAELKPSSAPGSCSKRFPRSWS